MEDRIERLEALAALQERTIEKLNDALYDQGQELRDLEKRLERLAGKVREMDDAMEQGGPHDAPPPHYGR